jgi:hypothetical protein
MKDAESLRPFERRDPRAPLSASNSAISLWESSISVQIRSEKNVQTNLQLEMTSKVSANLLIFVESW